jgi:electron transfer flavoprotein alpha/beta subunit
LRISACIKYIADYDTLSSYEWKEACETGVMDLSYANTIINPHDSYALEFALRVAEQSATFDVQVVPEVLTVGNPALVSELRTVAAIGIEDPVLLKVDAESVDAATVAQILHRHYVQTGLPEIILFGVSAGDRDSGVVPLLLAEYVGIPCLANVNRLELTENGLRCLALQEDVIHEVTVTEYPLVISVGNVDDLLLRSPTLKNALAARKKPITQIDVDLTGLSEADFGEQTGHEMNQTAKQADLRFTTDGKQVLAEVKGMLDMIR